MNGPNEPRCTSGEPCRVAVCGTCGRDHFPRYCDLCGGHACRDHECTWDDDENDEENET